MRLSRRESETQRPDRPGAALAAGAVTLTEAPRAATAVAHARTRFHDGMDDDFNSPVAVSALFDLARGINRARAGGGDAALIEQARSQLVTLADVLGLRLDVIGDVALGDAAPFIDLLLEVRRELRTAKQWALSDLIRDKLGDLGVAVEDGPSGATWSPKRG